MVELKPLEASDKDQFIKDNQEAFNYRETIENSIAEGEAYCIVVDGKNAGGLVRSRKENNKITLLLY